MQDPSAGVAYSFSREQQTDTFPKVLMANSLSRPEEIWMRKKQFGIWREFTWREGTEIVRYFSLGLRNLGYERGHPLVIIGDNSPQWFWAELAAQCLGGTIVGIAATASAAEVRDIVGESGAPFVLAQDQEQIDKVISVRTEVPCVHRVFYCDGRGLGEKGQPSLMSFDEVAEQGRSTGAPSILEEEISRGGRQDTAFAVYERGPDGSLRRSPITYEKAFTINAQLSHSYGKRSAIEWFSFNEPGEMVEQCFGLLGSLCRGTKMNFSERPDTVGEDMREIGPDLVFFPTAHWTNLAATIQERMRRTYWPVTFLYRSALWADSRQSGYPSEERPNNPCSRVVNRLSNLLVFNALRSRLGLLRTRVAYSLGEPLGPDVYRFFLAIGVDVRHYSLTPVGGTNPADHSDLCNGTTNYANIDKQPNVGNAH